MVTKRWKLVATITVIGLVIGFSYWVFGNMKNAHGLERNTLAVVNSTKITKEDFDKEFHNQGCT